jgi:predicted XRE-type DNA-binding protein
MSDESFEIVRGSGNVFSDFNHPDADAEQLKSLLAAKIIGVLKDRSLTVRKAEEITGMAARNFLRIRKAKLGRFTIDSLMAILNRLDQVVAVSVTVRPRHQYCGSTQGMS